MASGGRLAGKHALVTGASRGIGRAVAIRLAAEGARVAAGVRKEADGEALVAEIAAGGGEALWVTIDVTDPSSVATGVERAARPDRRIDILVNNAGANAGTPLNGDARSDENFLRMLDVNVAGTWRVCRAANPFLRDGGRVINFSSVTGRFGVPGISGYSAAKHALIGLTRCLALELAPRKITVNALCPGWVDTAMSRHSFHAIARQRGISDDEAFAFAGKMAPLGEVLKPDEIAGLVAYLASDEARNVTGQAIVIDGGQVMP